MATISPAKTAAIVTANVQVWTGVSTADTMVEYAPKGTEGLVSSVQVAGTFGGATITLEGSNDGTNYVTLKDVQGNDISFTAAGMAELSTAAVYVRPASSGGTSDNVNVTFAMRG